MTFLAGGLWVLVSVPIPLLADEATSHLNMGGTGRSIRPGENTVGAVRRMELEPPRLSIHRQWLVPSHQVKSEKFRSRISAYEY